MSIMINVLVPIITTFIVLGNVGQIQTGEITMGKGVLYIVITLIVAIIVLCINEYLDEIL